jgi:hypothetical protein
MGLISRDIENRAAAELQNIIVASLGYSIQTENSKSFESVVFHPQRYAKLLTDSPKHQSAQILPSKIKPLE